MSADRADDARRSTPLHILALSGSLRARSTNTELLRALALLAPPTLRVTLYEGLGDVPPFNPDLDEEGAAPPPPVQRLRTLLAAADGVVICSPEYAHGVAGALKNALDWLVSFAPMSDKPIALLNASARSTTANAALAETLRTMSTAWVGEASRTVPLDGRRLDGAQIAADPALAALLREVLAALEAAARTPCASREGLDPRGARPRVRRRSKGPTPMPVQLDHVILRVNDRATAIEFYTRIMGFTYEGEREPFSVIRVTPHLTLQLAPWGTEGGEHLAFAMGRAEFDAVFARVRDAGLAYGDSFHAVGNMRGPGDEAGSRGPGKAVYLNDPSKHLIEIRYYEA